jgi:hypothetical protein
LYFSNGDNNNSEVNKYEKYNVIRDRQRAINDLKTLLKLKTKI